MRVCVIQNAGGQMADLGIRYRTEPLVNLLYLSSQFCKFFVSSYLFKCHRERKWIMSHDFLSRETELTELISQEIQCQTMLCLKIACPKCLLRLERKSFLKPDKRSQYLTKKQNKEPERERTVRAAVRLNMWKSDKSTGAESNHLI